VDVKQTFFFIVVTDWASWTVLIQNSFWNTETFTQVYGRAPWNRGISPSHDFYLHRVAQHNTNTDVHPCPRAGFDSNPLYQRSSGPRPVTIAISGQP